MSYKLLSPVSSNIIPLTKWSDHHDWPPIGGLRHLVFHASENGFDRVIIRCGRRVLIDEARFFEWLDAQREGASDER